MANIRKTQAGTYKATIYAGRDADGKMIRKYVTREGLRECKAAARELEEEVSAKDLSNAGNKKVINYMGAWLDINRPLLAPTTVKLYKGYIENHFKPYFGRMKVNQVTELDIKKYIGEKLPELSATTVRKHFFTLQKIFRDAIKHRSPMVGMKPPKPGDFKPVVPTEEQFDVIHKAFKEAGIEFETAILLAGWCGLRRGEIFALKWDDINEADGYIRIDEALALKEDKYVFELKEPKSQRGIREVPAPAGLIQKLTAIRQGQKKRIRHQVFTINPDQFTGKYNRVMKKLGLNIRFHDLRHYHASILYKNNVPDLYAAEKLGHDIWVLKRIYQHLGLKETKSLDEKIKGLFE